MKNKQEILDVLQNYFGFDDFVQAKKRQLTPYWKEKTLYRFFPLVPGNPFYINCQLIYCQERSSLFHR